MSAFTEVRTKVHNAVRKFDWNTAAREAVAYAEVMKKAQAIEPETFDDLDLLLNNRQYGALMTIADAALAVDLDNRVVWMKYAQALVDQHRVAPAMGIYTRLAEKASTPAEEAEAIGGKGRCYKELFLLTEDRGRRTAYLANAYAAYSTLYQNSPTNIWHGINATALLAFAERNTLVIPEVPDLTYAVQQTAEAVLAEALKTEDDPWAIATASEANVALGDVDEASVQARILVASPHTFPFMIAAYLRQLKDVWQIGTDSPFNKTVLPLLQTALMLKSGAEVRLDHADVAAARIDELDEAERPGSESGMYFEKVFGDADFQTLRWFKTALLSCRAVARIDDLDGAGVGTGFLVEGRALHEDFPRYVVMTNSHVIPERLEHRDAVVTFHGLDDGVKQFAIKRILWSSPPKLPGLDTTVLELKDLPEGVLPVTFDEDVTPTVPSQAYIIGHPNGVDQPRFSIQDNELFEMDTTRLRYRVPTDNGSSGSPVFDDHWRLIGLHHAGKYSWSRLDGKGSSPANEGLRIDAIREAIKKNPKGDKLPE